MGKIDITIIGLAIAGIITLVSSGCKCDLKNKAIGVILLAIMSL